MGEQMNRETMKRILGDKPVGYHPIIAKCLKSATGALFFSQLMYWDSTLKEHRDGWFWKTHDEMTDETGLTRSEQDTARRELKKRGWIQEARRGIPARLWYRIEWDVFFDAIAAYKSEQKPQSSLQDSAIKSGQIAQSITESTTESTTESGDSKTESLTPKEKEPLTEVEYQIDEMSGILKDDNSANISAEAVFAGIQAQVDADRAERDATIAGARRTAGKQLVAQSDAEFAALPSASAGMPPVGKLTAGVATKRASDEEQVTAIAESLTAILYDAPCDLKKLPSSVRSTAKHLASEKLRDIQNGVMTRAQFDVQIARLRNGKRVTIAEMLEKAKDDKARLFKIVDAIDGAIAGKVSVTAAQQIGARDAGNLAAFVGRKR